MPRTQNWTKMRCPFHDDKHPSATVSLTKNRFVCFACGINENAAGLIKWKEGGSYADALKRAKEISGDGPNDLPGFDYEGDFISRRPGVRYGPGHEVGAWRSRVS